MSRKLYMCKFIHKFSRYVHADFIRHKNEVFQKFKDFHCRAERHTGCKLLALRTDRGSEYVNKFDAYMKQHGIRHDCTTAYSPENN